MNQQIQEVMKQAGTDCSGKWMGIDHAEKFAELIIQECVACCGSQADKRNIRYRFGLPVESNVQYEAPPIHGSVTSQYTREYNIPK